MSALDKSNDNIHVAVVEGFHPFEVPQWLELFQSLEGVTGYPQVIDNWAVDCAGCRRDYDVTLFYNMNMDLDTAPFREPLEGAVNDLGETEQGLVILHHALLAYPNWQVWSDMVGIQDRSFGFHVGQECTVQTANPGHPITKGLEPWVNQDETYTMADAGEGSDILFTADHPKSNRTIGWTRTHKKARVFCFQPGHDHLAWENPNFREVLTRGIQWAAGRL